jgi:hypothetical protein
MLYGKKHYKEQNVLKITSVGAYFVFGLKGVDIYDSFQYNTVTMRLSQMLIKQSW